MKVAFVTPELQSLVRRTQLAEIAEQLPQTLLQEGVDVRVFLPWFADIEVEALTGLEKRGEVTVPDAEETCTLAVHTAKLGQLPIVLIDHPTLFRERHPYGGNNGPYSDNWRRYAIFSRAVLESLQVLKFSADILHCLDWTSGLIPLIQELEYIDQRPEHPAARAGSYFAIHNLAVQGAFEREVLPKIGIPHRYFRAIEGVEHGARVNFLKAGAEFATIIGTHSESQVERMQMIDGAGGLETTFQRRRKEIVGVLSGIDYRAWDPSTDPLLAGNYSEKELGGKKRCKSTLQNGLKLDHGPRTPLVTIIGRFDADSGFDILAETLTPILERNLELVLMGPGQTEILDRLRTVEQTFAGRCRVIEGYHVGTAHTLLGGSDILLLPSHNHASNTLTAIAMRYGTIPVVYKKSGLEDTLVDWNDDKRRATGFMFERYASDSLLDGVDAARALYKKPTDWKRIVTRAMRQDLSWQESGRNYLKAYRRVTRRVRDRRTRP